jgi:hypothetical protein
MTDDRKSGLALIAGSAAGIITMAMHPTGHDLLIPGHLESVIRMGVAVHSLALASLPVLFLGAWGLSRRVGSDDRIALSAMVTYTFALIAVMNAAVFDGLVAPVLLRQMAAADPSLTGMWRMVVNYNFSQNQGFAQLYVAASSVAIVLWSISIIRSRTLARGVAIYGVVIATITVLALLAGHLRLNKHGFGAVWFSQAIWFVSVGVMLWRAGKAQDSSA